MGALLNIVHTRDPFNGQYTDDTQPVKHVVDGRSGESSSEFITFAGLPDRDDCVCHRRANVGAHDDEYGLTYVEH